MKKFRGILLIIVLCFGMIGCRGTSERERKAEQERNSPIEEVSDEVQMISCEFEGITYEIPEDWEEDDVNGKDKFYYPANGMLMVSFSEDVFESIFDMSEDFMEGMSKSCDYLDITQEGYILINSEKAYRVVADMGVSNRDLEAEIIVFNTEKGLASFVMGTYKDTDNSVSYRDAFGEILKSISFSPYVQPEESEEEEIEEEAQPEQQEELQEAPADEAPAVTTGQRNALSKAHSYLRFSSFSYTGLIGQLEYEGFSNEEAVYAVDNCGADWNEQAAEKAQSYLNFSSFSRQGLIDQLIFEGFTAEQAEYGVAAVGY